MKNWEDRIKIDQNALNDELVVQPELFLVASRSYVDAVSERDAAKSNLDVARAAADFRVRAAREAAGEKSTETIIASAVELDKKYRVAVERHLAAKKAAAEAEAVKESFGQRGYVLKDLAALYIAGYYATSSVSGPDSREVQKQDYEIKRTEIAKRRRNRLQ
ncbi:MAG: hypothetical protein ABIH23_18995 [bacterium]